MSKTKLYIGAMLYWLRYFIHWCRGHKKRVKTAIIEGLILIAFFTEMVFLCGALG